MLKKLSIRNLILVDSAEISFESSLNVLSGETGSGKSAIMHALGLVTGERADAGLIRHGEEKGSVEALFEIQGYPEVRALLAEYGIDHDEDADLIMRREISQNGKSRALINHQTVQLHLVRQIADRLIEIVGQHANQLLSDPENHRRIVDLFSNLQPEASEFSVNWQREKRVRSDLEALLQSESQRLRTLDSLQREREELVNARLRSGEEEELDAEYSMLSNAEEICSKSQEVCTLLNGERQSVLPQLSKGQGVLQYLVHLDPSLSDAAESYAGALIELQEVSRTLQNYVQHIEYNPERVSHLNERLALINKLKKRYGSTVEEISVYEQTIGTRLQQLQNADVQIEELREELQLLESANDAAAKALSSKRLVGARDLKKAMEAQLYSLNMPKVEFECRIIEQPRSQHGDEAIEFFFRPNTGESFISVRNCASGGELSRLMLALQVLLIGKRGIPTLVFDEIDANIGGETALIVGQKLREIGKGHQVLCITHFPQVAQHAQHHLHISKHEHENRTITTIRVLDNAAKERELARMHGLT